MIFLASYEFQTEGDTEVLATALIEWRRCTRT